MNFPAYLLLLFIGLKLGGAIDWSWWWVLSPMWLGLAVFAIIYAFIFVGVWIDRQTNKWRTR